MMRNKTFIKFVIRILPPLFFLQAHGNFLELRASYFYSINSRFQDIYSGASLNSIETTILTQKKQSLWASLGFLYASGNSIGNDDKTQLYALPLNFGIKYFFFKSCAQPYLGIGIASIPFSRIHNHSYYVSHHQYGWGIGGIVKSGLILYKNESRLFNFFLDYTYLKMSYNHTNKIVITHKGNLNGISTGLGLGFFF